MQNTTIDYGKTIRELRTKNKWTQAALAELVGIKKTTVSNYEIGYTTPSAPVLEKMAKAFSMSFADFVSYGLPKQNDKFNLPRVKQAVNDKIIPYIKASNITPSILEASNYMDSYISLPNFMLKDDGDYLCIKMPDGSMENDKIYKNDYIIVKRGDFAESGRVVLAIYQPTNTYIIRKYIRDGHVISFIPSSMSSDYQIIRADERDKDATIIGTVERAFVSIK